MLFMRRSSQSRLLSLYRLAGSVPEIVLSLRSRCLRTGKELQAEGTLPAIKLRPRFSHFRLGRREPQLGASLPERLLSDRSRVFNEHADG